MTFTDPKTWLITGAARGMGVDFATPDIPPDDLVPSLLSASDVLAPAGSGPSRPRPDPARP